MGRWIGRFVFVVAAAGGALVLAEACADPIGTMLVDAGGLLMDAGSEEAGETVGDGGQTVVGDADASGRDAAANGARDSGPDGDGDGARDAGSDVRDAGRELMRDAGAWLVDAGTAMRDAGTDAAAEADPQISVSGSRIEVRWPVQEGSDGSRFAGYTQVLFDTELDVPCTLSKTTDGKTRCVPMEGAAYVFNLYFSDAGCMTPLAVVTTPCAAAPKYGFAQSTLDCGVGYTIYKVSAQHTGPVYTGSPASCSAATKPAGYTFYSVAAMAPTSFVEFTAGAPIVLQ